MRLEQIINKYYDHLNENDLHVLSFITQNIDFCIDRTVSEIAEYSNVSPSTIIRMTKKLDFKGYSEFRYFLKEESKKKQQSKKNDVDLFRTSTVLEDVRETIRLFEQDNSIEEIYKVLEESNKIFGYATGYGQELMLKEFSRILTNKNIYLFQIPSKSELELISENMTSKDLIFVISLSGNIEEIESVLKKIRLNGVTIVSVTSFSRNDLSYLADYNLYYQVSNINKNSNLNRTSYYTLNLTLSLLYEGFINYLDEKHK